MLAKDIRAGKCYRIKEGDTRIIFHVSSIVISNTHLIKVYIFKGINCTQRAFTIGHKDVMYLRYEKEVEPFPLDSFNQAFDKFNDIKKLCL